MRRCDRHSADRWVLTALAGFLLYAGGPADHVPAASIVGLAALLDEGFYLAVSGVSWIPAVLAVGLASRGGRVNLRCSIERIHASRGVPQWTHTFDV